MNYKRHVVVLSLLALVASFGCSENVESVPIEEFDDAQKLAWCDWVVGCGIYDTAETCLSGVESEWLVLLGVADGTIIYDGAAAAACIDRTDSPCTFVEYRRGITGCTDAFQGTLTEGASCYEHLQCISSFCAGACVYMCCAGTCTAGDNTPAPDGASCAAAWCGTDSYCASEQICRAHKTLGQACVYSYECQPDLTCYTQFGNGGDTTCAPIVGPGDACTNLPSPCQLNTIGHFCDASTVTCQPFLFEGDRCAGNDGCAPGYLTCSPTTGLCERRTAAGDTCGSTNRCAPGVYCDLNLMLCRTYQSEGGSCADNLRCDWHLTCNAQSLICEKTTCL